MQNLNIEHENEINSLINAHISCRHEVEKTMVNREFALDVIKIISNKDE